MKIAAQVTGIMICSATFFSCIGPQKMREAKERLNLIKEGQTNEIERVNAINSTNSKKLQQDKIDSIINKRVDFRVGRINQQMDSISGIIRDLDSLMRNKRSLRRAYKKIIVPQLTLLDSFRQANANRSEVYLMLEDGLNTSDYTLYQLAAYFGPGKYVIPEDQLEATATSFAPLVDSLLKFSGKYKNLKQTAVLIIMGFADATGFDQETPLYTELASLVGRQEVTKGVLNQKLSELRAESLIKQLRNQVIKRLGGVEETQNITIEYICQGKGEELPLKFITDYTDDDERRRIVLCYWAILPK